MIITVIDDDREAIRQACIFHGGATAAALKAGIQSSSLTRWLNGQKTLSNESVLKLLEAIGMPRGMADSNKVHNWYISWKNPKTFKSGLRMYFPNGAEVAHAPWSKWSIEAFYRQITDGIGKADNPPEVYALTDGTNRAVLRRSPGTPITLGEFGERFSWKGGNFKSAELRIDVWDGAWRGGNITKEEFDDAWNGKIITWDVIEKTAEETGYTKKLMVEFMKKNRIKK